MDEEVAKMWESLTTAHNNVAAYIDDLQERLERAEDEVRILRIQDDTNNGSESEMSLRIAVQKALNTAAKESNPRRTMFVNELNRALRDIGLAVPTNAAEMAELCKDPRVRP